MSKIEGEPDSPLIEGPASGVCQDHTRRRPVLFPPKPASGPKPVKKKVAVREYDLCSYEVKGFYYTRRQER